MSDHEMPPNATWLRNRVGEKFKLEFPNGEFVVSVQEVNDDGS